MRSCAASAGSQAGAAAAIASTRAVRVLRATRSRTLRAAWEPELSPARKMARLKALVAALRLALRSDMAAAS